MSYIPRVSAASLVDGAHNAMFHGNTRKLQNGLTRERPTRLELHELLVYVLTASDWVAEPRHEYLSKTVKVLLNHGAPVNMNPSRPSAHMPLFMAIQMKNDALVRLLLDHGSNPNQRDADGFTALHRASTIPNNEKIIRLLLRKRKKENGSNVNGANVNAKTPRVDTGVNWLVIESENTPLHLAVHREKEKNVRVLVDVGKAKLNIKNSEGDTPLHIAASRNEKVVQFLIDRGAHVNIKNTRGETPLHVAAYHGKKKNVKILLQNGAIPFVQDSWGRTPADVIEPSNPTQVIRRIRRTLDTWPGQRSALRRMATASLNSVRNKKSGQKLYIPNNIKQRILSQTGLFRRNQFGRPINTNNAEIRNAWAKEKQRRDRKRKRNNK
jgi:ankyrin repeat protein